MLRKLWANMDAAIAAGDMRGEYFKKSLRVLAAGGDGTVAWVLGTIRQVTRIHSLGKNLASCRSSREIILRWVSIWESDNQVEFDSMN